MSYRWESLRAFHLLHREVIAVPSRAKRIRFHTKLPICGSRFITDAETKTMGLPGSEFVLKDVLSEYERNYHAVLIDVRTFH